jgi:CheY-like chemotaxis protein
MKRVLVVEDDAVVMDLIAILLEHEGYDVIRACSAEAGITLAAEQRPDLILMDVALPGMNGLEGTRVLKSRADTARIPVVALTAQVMERDREDAVRAGCDGFIPKPLSTPQFLAEIARFLGGGKE